MLELLRELMAHKAHADSVVLATVRNSANAAADSDVAELLHHILLANRFWLLSIVGRPFVLAEESRRSASYEELVERYRVTHEAELQWLASASEADLMRIVEGPLIPGGSASVLDVWMQVCLHSHGHRAQCATLLRKCGAVTPPLDFIVWRCTRPEADWIGTGDPYRASVADDLNGSGP